VENRISTPTIALQAVGLDGVGDFVEGERGDRPRCCDLGLAFRKNRKPISPRSTPYDHAARIRLDVARG